MQESFKNVIDEQLLDDCISRALDEDVQDGDVTTDAMVDSPQQASAVWRSKDEGILAGLPVAEAVFQKLDADLKWNPKAKDGQKIKVGSEIVKINASARAILTAERIALNFVQRMSGIATKARQFVEETDGFKAQILDTRKTVPGLRRLDKYAVAMGGAKNHRMGLYDMAMIKDNHIVAAGSISKAVQEVRNNYPDMEVEVETTNLSEVQEALSAGADIIMLDNMDNERMEKAVEQTDGEAKTEASGNVSLRRIAGIAATGVDYISSGAITHSVSAFDISQELIEIKST